MDTVERISGFSDLRKVTGRMERLFYFPVKCLCYNFRKRLILFYLHLSKIRKQSLSAFYLFIDNHYHTITILVIIFIFSNR